MALMPILWKLLGLSPRRLRDWQYANQSSIVRLGIVFMTIIALPRLGYEFWRLVFSMGPNGAIDLRIYYNLVHAWFAGRPIYAELISSVYPPATHVILWPFMGWLPLQQARWLWAATSLGALGWLAYLVVKEANLKTRLQRAFAILFLLSMYATAITIGNGQTILHILPALVTGLILLHRRRAGLGRDLLASFLFLVALAKPSISVPFLWLVAFCSGALRPAAFIALGYGALTLLAVSFQDQGLLTLFHGWLERCSTLAGREGYANLHFWLSAVGMKEYFFPASFLALLALGIWTHLHRSDDLWRLIGVAALAARLWTYHRLYDDLLILLPMIALFRFARSGAYSDGSDAAAGTLLGISWAAMLIPGTLLRLPSPWGSPFRSGQAIIWILMLLFLLFRDARPAEKNLKAENIQK